MTQDQSPAKAQGVSEAIHPKLEQMLAKWESAGYRHVMLPGTSMTCDIAACLIRTARPSGAEAKPVAVKALEWENVDATFWRAAGLESWYRICLLGGDWVPQWGAHQAVPLEAAKAAAQADYEQRIRSALIAATPVPAAQPAGTHSDPICQKCASNSEGGVPVECTCGDYATPVPATTAQGVTPRCAHCGAVPAGNCGAYGAEIPRERCPNLSLPATATARPLNSGEVEAKFDQWWKSSKYRQVIFASESDRQIAFDAWNAALSPAPSTPDGWRDMSSAPKDGTKVDLWCRAPGLSAGPDRVTDCWFSDGKWWRYDEQFGDDFKRSRVHNATHWMPLPTPPAGGSDA